MIMKELKEIEEMLATLLKKEDWHNNLRAFCAGMQEFINLLRETLELGDRYRAYHLIEDIADTAIAMHKRNERELNLRDSCSRLLTYIRENTPAEESSTESE